MRTVLESRDLEISLLRTFLAVVQHGSLGKAAVAVDKTQPAISQQMFRLEEIVGQKLFARGRNGIRLTHHGDLLVAYANRAIDLNEEAVLRLRQESLVKRVALGIAPDVALVGLASTLKRFQSVRPDIELRVVVARPESTRWPLENRATAFGDCGSKFDDGSVCGNLVGLVGMGWIERIGG